MFFVERLIILCPHLGKSTIGGSNVVVNSSMPRNREYRESYWGCVKFALSEGIYSDKEDCRMGLTRIIHYNFCE